MKMRQYLPVILIVAVLGVLAGAQTFLARGPEPNSPELYQSQVGKPGNFLENMAEFELDIELRDNKRVKMHHLKNEQDSAMASVLRGDRSDTENPISGEQAVQEIKNLVGSLPSFTAKEPLALIKAVLDQLEIHEKDLREFELAYELADGTRGSVELDVDDFDESDKVNKTSPSMSGD